ncbi:MAG: glycosyltransferase family 9 protein [Xanthomonadaceae bacterium]|nr:glycosyltransferase family 9 protein [Xanthomonadaceae bacterium]
MREPQETGIRRILILKWSALGDVALATVAIEDIRLQFPQAVLHLDTLPSAQRLFAADPRFDAVFALPMRDRKQRWRAHWQWLRRVRDARYDLIVDLQSSDHTRILLACLAFGHGKVRQRWGIRRGFPYTLAPPADTGPHPAQRMRALLACAGIRARTARPVLHASPAQRARVAAVLRERGAISGRYAVLLPGSQAGGWLKRWGVERYAELGLLLHARGMQRILVIGARAEADDCVRIVAAIQTRVPGVALHLADLDLLEIIPVCEGAACVIANDTGTAHIAAAAGRPLWVLCGPTDPRRVRPLGAFAVQANHPCLDCYRKTCRWGPKPQCLERIEPAAVLALALGDAGAIDGLTIHADGAP